MQVQIAKWGNSLGLRVPRDVAARAGLTEGTRVDVEAQSDGAIVIRKSTRRFTLEEMIAGMTPDKQHPPLIDDEPRGSEFPNEEP
ncbi:MAG: AbrB/MazE/SpoVT family DNA-binding domain-containing protein [Alphaproteobacteria bacterium]|nr:AbrB/MazE/SpoVT family DNA-binding domain-containing protein [Alphaproteobacteria bacterium]